MTAPRPFAEVVAELLAKYRKAETSVIYEMSGSISNEMNWLKEECQGYEAELAALLSRLASREAVFEAAVGWARRTKDEAHYDNAQEERLRAAIEAARALDAATPQGEETK